MLIARFLKELRKNVYTIIIFINQSKTLIEMIIIVTKINNRLYQIKTNNRNSRTQKNIISNAQRNDLMNLNANEIDRKKCYNCEKKSHIIKKCKTLKSTQQFDILKEYLDEKIRKHLWKKKTRIQVLKKNEQKNNFEKDLRYRKECVFFTTRIYRLLHSMTSVIDKKQKK